jgi:hypothetical protein
VQSGSFFIVVRLILMSTARDNLKLGFDRTFWSFGIGLLFLMVALLVGPRLPDEQQAAQCVASVHLQQP